MEDDVRGTLAGSAKDAANVVVGMLRSKDSEIKFNAAKDVLNRTGFSPQQVVNHKVSFEDELVIRHVKSSNTYEDAPVIEMDPLNA